MSDAEPPPSQAFIQSRLYEAARGGSLPGLLIALRNGAFYDQPDEQGFTAMMLAVRHRHSMAMQMLLDGGADIDLAGDAHGNTPLIAAVAQGDAALVGEMLERGADPNRANRFGRTALMAAASLGRDEMVDLLLGQFADVEPRDADGLTASAHAAGQGHDRLAARLKPIPSR